MMAGNTIRSTIYLDPDLHQALRLKAAVGGKSISELVNESIRESLREDETDLKAFALRAAEEPVSYETFLAKLKADGTI